MQDSKFKYRNAYALFCPRCDEANTSYDEGDALAYCYWCGVYFRPQWYVNDSGEEIEVDQIDSNDDNLNEEEN